MKTKRVSILIVTSSLIQSHLFQVDKKGVLNSWNFYPLTKFVEDLNLRRDSLNLCRDTKALNDAITRWEVKLLTNYQNHWVCTNWLDCFASSSKSEPSIKSTRGRKVINCDYFTCYTAILHIIACWLKGLEKAKMTGISVGCKPSFSLSAYLLISITEDGFQSSKNRLCHWPFLGFFFVKDNQCSGKRRCLSGTYWKNSIKESIAHTLEMLELAKNMARKTVKMVKF